MDDLPWNESTTLERVRVPYVCRDGPCQSSTSDEFKEFPQSQGWKLDESDSLAQLAERAQAWLFFGLLSVAGVSSDACIELDRDQPLINTKMLPDLLRFATYTNYDEREITLVELIPTIAVVTDVMLEQVIPLLRDYEALESIDLWNSTPYAILFSIDVLLDTMKAPLRSIAQRRKQIDSPRSSVPTRSSISKQPSKSRHSNISERPGIAQPPMTTALLSVPDQSAAPEQPKVAGESSRSEQSNTFHAASFLDELDIAFAVKPIRQDSLLPKSTQGVARSLLRAGRCGSLAQRLNLTSSGLYYLISLPSTSSSSQDGERERERHGEDHTQCSPTSCSYFNVNEATYRPRHTRDCIMCDGLEVDESKLVDLIRKDEVPVIRSTMGRDGRLSICVQKMTKNVDYTAISHVWAGGLGNFQRNQLPQCQLESIHRDVCRTMACAFLDSFELEWESASKHLKSWLRPMRMSSSWLMKMCSPWIMGTKFSSWLVGTTTCYYWMDTLCIPNNHPAERKEAINSMGRVYAGAGAVLVLDPALSSIALQDDRLAGEDQDMARNMLVKASPWMARSWPLQEAALASGLYIKFADEYVRYDHKDLGMAATLDAVPNRDKSQLHWLTDDPKSYDYLKFWSLFTKRITSHSADRGDDEEIALGQSRSYTPGADFVKVWNLLSKRTTSYSVDVPSIFAALLYQSAGEILAIDPAHRAQSLLGSIDQLPADILCVELEKGSSTGLPLPQHPQQWMPRLPGSSRPVMSLSLEFGSMRLTTSGFTLQMRHPSMLAVVCRKALPMASGGHFLMREDGQQSFLVHLQEPMNGPNTNSTTTKGKSINRSPPEQETDQEEEPQLILLFRKTAPGSLLENCAVVCKINSEGEDRGTLRVQFLSNAITWRLLSEREQQPPLVYETRDCVSIDTSSSILIEMDTKHWPILAWSRLNAYPYRHLLAQAFQLHDVVIMAIQRASWVGTVVAWLPGYLIYFTGADEHNSMLTFLGTIIIHPITLALRISVAVVYMTLLSVTQKRRARYFWSLSFWDVRHARKTLSGVPFYVPWYFLVFDVAVLAVVVGLSFQTLWFVQLPTNSQILSVSMHIFLLFEYGLRLAKHLFARVQWFLSTLEYRGPHDPHCRRARLITLSLRYGAVALL